MLGGRWQLGLRHSAIGPELSAALAPTGVRALLTRADLAIGDDAFDAAVQLDGPEPLLRAVLDKTTRERLHAALANDTTLESGVVRWVAPPPRNGEIPLRELSTLARKLARPDDLERTLLDVATSEHEPDAVAVGAGRVLGERDPDQIRRVPERVLLGLLASSTLRIPALGQLQRMGSTSAIGPIVAASTGVFVSGALREAGRRAVAGIEARSKTRRGQLSISATGGELSAAMDSGGLSESGGR
jgi:hypothetical protein